MIRQVFATVVIARKTKLKLGGTWRQPSKKLYSPR